MGIQSLYTIYTIYKIFKHDIAMQRITDGSVPHANDGGPELINLSSGANRPPLRYSLPIPFIARYTVIPGKGEKTFVAISPARSVSRVGFR